MLTSNTHQAIALARHHQQAGRLDIAEEIYRKLLAADPRNPDLLHLVGLVLRQRGDNASAVEYIREAIQRKPSNPEAFYNLANTLNDLGRLEEAVAAYRKAIVLRPGLALAHSNLGVVLAKIKRYEEAVIEYRHALRIDPNAPNAWPNLGHALRELKRYDEAIAALQKATLTAPNSAEVFQNLGFCLSLKGKAKPATDAFGRALALSPESADAHNNYSVSLRLSGRFAEAIDTSRRAVAKFPQTISCHLCLAHCLHEKQDWEQAIEAYSTVISMNPDSIPGYLGLSQVLKEQGKLSEAIETLQAGRRRGIDSEAFSFELAALGVGEMPPAPPTGYVVSLFNEYAGRFDQHLVNTLHYIGPQLLFDAVAAVSPREPMDILDLGCGTGLCGVLFKRLARRLIGVDLAPKMVEKARLRGVYDEVNEQDVTAALEAKPQGLDLVLAADVFIYVGSLDTVFPAASAALRPGGLLAFTVESIEPQSSGAEPETAPADFVLRSTLRYAHSTGYIQRLADMHGFAIVSVQDAVIRTELGNPVAGKVVLLRADHPAGAGGG